MHDGRTRKAKNIASEFVSWYLKKEAEKDGVSIEEKRNETEDMMLESMKNARNDDDPEKVAFWQKVCAKGNKPSFDEFVVQVYLLMIDGRTESES